MYRQLMEESNLSINKVLDHGLKLLRELVAFSHVELTAQFYLQ
jgi:hypothetical protein